MEHYYCIFIGKLSRFSNIDSDSNSSTIGWDMLQKMYPLILSL
jgi:hypothetical protein